ncbi:MAG: undecaprenyl/decaprenyl-phosphate alpha-N-acetylglucosaminyl 1-phosphate transferase [Planctomycetota bacterium]|jgi:UDP-GlcNAc:undecaprenyl-phosphate GlcNAc-1-phosphate transferase|nr:MAG: undecaprenyl/decaprenyl-phosphate alpha-N-acetylglucosaminyl 1-phosphate transferase [Planctomycetota bacterium]
MLEFLSVGFFISAIFACAVTPLIRKWAPALGLIDLPGHRKVHVLPTPRGGGIAIFVGIFIPILALSIFGLLGEHTRFQGLQDIAAELGNDSRRLIQMSSIAIGAIVLFLTGLADDRWNLSWKFRLVLQLSVAVGVVMAGVRATVFVDQPWFGFAATVLWILVLTNAMNFLDNMDALSAGIGLIASLIFAGIMVVMVRTPTMSVALPLVLLSGALMGFLFWNRPPASIFMGDCGSNLIGFLLATLTVTGTFYESTGSRHVMLAPLCVMAVPLYDFCTVILIRLSQRRSPFHGDKSHFSHRLVELGMRPAHAVLTIHLTTAMTGLGGLLLYKVPDWAGATLVVALIFCVLAIIAILETVGRRSVIGMQETLTEVRAAQTTIAEQISEP